jgi:hypothetical protein
VTSINRRKTQKKFQNSDDADDDTSDNASDHEPDTTIKNLDQQIANLPLLQKQLSLPRGSQKQRLSREETATTFRNDSAQAGASLEEVD